MRILALQAYDAASHRAFLDGWREYSRHAFDALRLPGRHFKWRMRQAPIELARQIEGLTEHGDRSVSSANAPWDALFCTSMLDLAALRGLSTIASRLPAVLYFHENQLTYPARFAGERDAHFGLTQVTAALAAIASHEPRDGSPPRCIWWNSAYNRDSFLDALRALLHRVPDFPMNGVVESIEAASAIRYPGINPVDASREDAQTHRDRPSVLLWAARWEYDKGPAVFFEALDRLDRQGVPFRVSVIGEQFAHAPDCFEAAKSRLGQRVLRWGYQPSREAYEQTLREADIVVSTSTHEFFGLAIAEAISAGCKAVLPDALAYPELWGNAALYHDGSAQDVAERMKQAIESPVLSREHNETHRFSWTTVAPKMDDAFEALFSIRG